MEIPAEPSTTAIFKALMSKGTDPQLASTPLRKSGNW